MRTAKETPPHEAVALSPLLKMITEYELASGEKNVVGWLAPPLWLLLVVVVMVVVIVVHERTKKRSNDI